MYVRLFIWCFDYNSVYFLGKFSSHQFFCSQILLNCIALFVKILVFAKILSQWRRNKEERIWILRSAITSSSHLKSDFKKTSKRVLVPLCLMSGRSRSTDRSAVSTPCQCIFNEPNGKKDSFFCYKCRLKKSLVLQAKDLDYRI